MADTDTIKMEDKSILESIKKAIGYDKAYDVYDLDFIMYINSAFAILQQIGFGPNSAFIIDGYGQTWKDFSTDPMVGMAYTYVIDKVRLSHDMVQHGPGIAAIQERIKEHEWRLSVAGERTTYE